MQETLVERLKRLSSEKGVPPAEIEAALGIPFLALEFTRATDFPRPTLAAWKEAASVLGVHPAYLLELAHEPAAYERACFDERLEKHPALVWKHDPEKLWDLVRTQLEDTRHRSNRPVPVTHTIHQLLDEIEKQLDNEPPRHSGGNSRKNATTAYQTQFGELRYCPYPDCGALITLSSPTCSKCLRRLPDGD